MPTRSSRSTIQGSSAPRLVKHGSLKVIAGAPHGLCTTHADVINQELLTFLEKQQMAA
jgi:non-heme chloroperoxidase